MTTHRSCTFTGTLLFVLAVMATLCPLSQAQDRNEVRANYILGPNDQLTISALDADEISGKTYRVGSDGEITIPMIGRFMAAGLTSEQLESELALALGKYIRHPKVAVTVTEFNSQPVSVIGAVTTPGIIQLQGKKNLVEVLSMAGGLRNDAGQSVRITRRLEWGPLPLPGAGPDPTGAFSVAEVKVKDVLEARNPEQNITIQPNDIISVPGAETIYVLGAVRRAGRHVLTEDTLSVLQALSISEGLERTAAEEKSRILRIAPGATRRTEIPVDLKSIFAGKTPDIALQADDILFIPDSTQKRAVLRTLEALMSIGTTAGAGAILYGSGR